MITLKSCPVCDSHRITQYRQVIQTPDVLYELMPGVTVNALITTRYCVCQDCSVIFQNPRLSDTELHTFYSQGYYRRTVNASNEEMEGEELYRANGDAEIIKRYTGKLTSHLDIGCGRGCLLDAIDAAVRVGVESDVGYVRVKGVEIYPEVHRVPRKSFDLVTAIHVLEHVPKPLDYLQRMAAFIRTGGHLVIEVPTWKSPGGPLRLAHLFHFETDVLKLMCVQAGLRVLQVEFTPHLMLICKVDHN